MKPGPALCSDMDPELFFPEDDATVEDAQVKEAKDVCERCPGKFQCLLLAIKNREEYGIWGGTLPSERDELVRRLSQR